LCNPLLLLIFSFIIIIIFLQIYYYFLCNNRQNTLYKFCTNAEFFQNTKQVVQTDINYEQEYNEAFKKLGNMPPFQKEGGGFNWENEEILEKLLTKIAAGKDGKNNKKCDTEILNKCEDGTNYLGENINECCSCNNLGRDSIGFSC